MATYYCCHCRPPCATSAPAIDPVHLSSQKAPDLVVEFNSEATTPLVIVTAT
uniref:Uncharacterized protein n=1 Tax=Oryza sativa subsp. japonica TaxID=39947 RepID=Q7EZ22_ORYSJ|nr:hypothetical protein [Oryza sativa Japonica Group]BAC83757.1 hypothetical protein [Oryza sativa Japonica Group]